MLCEPRYNRGKHAWTAILQTYPDRARSICFEYFALLCAWDRHNILRGFKFLRIYETREMPFPCFFLCMRWIDQCSLGPHSIWFQHLKVYSFISEYSGNNMLRCWKGKFVQVLSWFYWKRENERNRLVKIWRKSIYKSYTIKCKLVTPWHTFPGPSNCTLKWIMNFHFL